MPRPVDQPAPAAMSEAKRAYEAKRAAAAGLSLEAWLAQKRRREAAPAPAAPPGARKKGLLSRWLDRAHQPLK